MANPRDIFISYEKPKQSSKAFFFVSQGLLSALHIEKLGNSLDLFQTDSSRRTLLHYSCYLDLHAITLYLLTNGLDLNTLDKQGQSCYFALLGKGNFLSLQMILNYFRHVYLKELYDWTTLLKFGFSMQNITLRNTIALYLAKTITFTKLPEKPLESKLELAKRLEVFFKKNLDFYKLAFTTQDNYKRNCLHYAAISKFTWCFKAVEVLLDDSEKLVGLAGFQEFCSMFAQVSALKSSVKVDPLRFVSILDTAKEVLGDLYDKSLNLYLTGLRQVKVSALNCKDINGQSPLHLACLSGDFKIVKLLIKHGADKNLRDKQGQRPLDLCSTKLVMRYLSSLNQVVTENDSAGLTHLANSGYDVNDSSNTYLLNSLHLAVINGGLLKNVLGFEGKVDQCEWNNYTALHIACIKGSLEDVKLLLKEKANPMARSSAGLTPLHLACRYDQVALVGVLVEDNADINAVDHSGRTPLMLACKHGAIRAARELLNLRCDLYRTDSRAWNALHYASFHCKARVVKMIVKWDSDQNLLISMKNSQGKTPLALTSDLKTRKAFESIS